MTADFKREDDLGRVGGGVVTRPRRRSRRRRRSRIRIGGEEGVDAAEGGLNDNEVEERGGKGGGRGE